jgi:hypothetical protein
MLRQGTHPHPLKSTGGDSGRTIDDVPCVVADSDKDGLPLLGQTVLARFNRWTIDNVHHTLIVA